MGLVPATHLVCAVAFLALALLIAAGKPANLSGWLALVASCLSAVWALISGFADRTFIEAVPLAETVRSIGWLAFGAAVLVNAAGGVIGLGKRWLLTGFGVVFCVIAIDFVHFAVDIKGIPLTANELLGHISVAILGIVLYENLYRNSSPESRWAVAPLCIGVGGMFALDLAVYSDFFLLRREDALFLSTRALADAIAVPFIALAIARNRNWRIDIHVSRDVVFHTASFIVSGAFILAVVAVSTVLSPNGGEWGEVAQFSILFASVLALALALASASIRSRIKHLIAEHFFSHRYDYRAEWIKFSDALSSADSANLYERVLKAIADIVDSPAGALWIRTGRAYRPAASWNMHVDSTTELAPDSDLILSLDKGTKVRLFAELSTGARPMGLESSNSLWIAIPLQHRGDVLGFIALTSPRAPLPLDWEVLQLLLTVSKQAATHIAEAQAAIALADSKLLADYSKRFAFVVHDIKNLVSQLSLVLSNAETFWQDPAFQDDALQTIRSSVDRMLKLLQQLKSVGAASLLELRADVGAVARDIATEMNRNGAGVLAVFSDPAPQASIDPMILHSALTHLVTNGLEASPEQRPVTIKVEVSGGLVAIDVTDHGRGMEASFIQNELFRPFRSTKASGYGIGVFQVRELARAAGGDLVVQSKPGYGTTMRLLLPAVKQPQPPILSVA